MLCFRVIRLNAPFGAQCFPTENDNYVIDVHQVSMHLLVLSAFRQRMALFVGQRLRSQCTFWCSVLSDLDCVACDSRYNRVSMHLLVLSAFRHERGIP